MDRPGVLATGFIVHAHEKAAFSTDSSHLDFVLFASVGLIRSSVVDCLDGDAMLAIASHIEAYIEAGIQPAKMETAGAKLS